MGIPFEDQFEKATEKAIATQGTGEVKGAAQESSIDYLGRGPMGVAGDPYWQERQRGLGEQLYQQMMGQGAPSLAEMQMQEAYGQAMGQQLGLAAGQRGRNVGLANRAAMQNIAQLQGQQARGGSQLRAQEQLAAQQAYGGLIGQAQQYGLGLEDVMARNYASAMGLFAPQPKQDTTSSWIGAGGTVLASLFGD